MQDKKLRKQFDASLFELGKELLSKKQIDNVRKGEYVIVLKR